MSQDVTTIDRRKFLKITGCGAVIALVGSGCSRTTEAKAACPYGLTNDPYPGECRRYVDSNGSGFCDYSENTNTQQATSTAIPSAPAATATQPIQSTPTVQGVAVCNRGCRYPGDCGQYIDNNNTGICDWSETTNTQPATSANAIEQPTATAAQSNSTATQNNTSTGQGVAVCNRGCRYPGHCGRYTDSNNTGICDLSEGVSTGSSTARPARPGGRPR